MVLDGWGWHGGCPELVELLADALEVAPKEWRLESRQDEVASDGLRRHTVLGCLQKVMRTQRQVVGLASDWRAS